VVYIKMLIFQHKEQKLLSQLPGSFSL